MRALAVAMGVVMILTGAAWTAQGMGYLEGSPMTGVEIWATIGPILAGFGVALVWVGLRRRDGRSS